jgi:hypothetical protein
MGFWFVFEKKGSFDERSYEGPWEGSSKGPMEGLLKVLCKVRRKVYRRCFARGGLFIRFIFHKPR